MMLILPVYGCGYRVHGSAGRLKPKPLETPGERRVNVMENDAARPSRARCAPHGLGVGDGVTQRPRRRRRLHAYIRVTIRACELPPRRVVSELNDASGV